MFPGNTYKDQSLGPDQIRMLGRFTANGSGAVTSPYGKGFTVARTATGTYVVSLGTANYPTPFRRLLAFLSGWMVANGVYANLKVLTDNSGSYTAPSVTLVNCDTSGNPADITGTFSFEFVFGVSELNS